MTDKQILQGICEKAVKNGYNPIDDMGDVKRIEVVDDNYSVWFYTGLDHEGGCLILPQIIFNHDFAKAFWGEKDMHSHLEESHKQYPMWKWHLGQMVLEKEPLKYLEKWL